MAFIDILHQRAKKNTQGKVTQKFGVYEVLQGPVLTEKTYKDQEKKNKYVFRIHRNANKNDVKQAVVFFYKVTPLDVNIINVIDKRRTQRGLVRKAYKKAIVTLSQKDKIEMGA